MTFILNNTLTSILIIINGRNTLFLHVTSTYNHVGYLHLSSHSWIDSFREHHFYCLNIYTFFLKNHLPFNVCYIRLYRIFLYRLSPENWQEFIFSTFSHQNAMRLPYTIDTPSNELIGLIKEIEFLSNLIFIESNRKYIFGPHWNEMIDRTYWIKFI